MEEDPTASARWRLRHAETTNLASSASKSFRAIVMWLTETVSKERDYQEAQRCLVVALFGSRAVPAAANSLSHTRNRLPARVRTRTHRRAGAEHRAGARRPRDCGLL